MSPETVRIDELVLRLPGVDVDRAHALADEVARRLAQALRVRALVSVPAALALRVRVPDRTPPEEMAESIARQVLEALE
jgi:hypothetical protein